MAHLAPRRVVAFASRVFAFTALCALAACPSSSSSKSADADAAVPEAAPETAPPGAATPTPPATPPVDGAGDVVENGATCQADADCALIDRGCCPCSAAGSRTAVLQSEAAARTASMRADCAGTMCAQMISRHPSCAPGTRAACQEGACVVVPGAAGVGVEPIELPAPNPPVTP